MIFDSYYIEKPDQSTDWSGFFLQFEIALAASGSHIEFDKNRAYLYTKNYMPELDTYSGVHITDPFEVTREKWNTTISELCNEILALTKLNWNTVYFYCGLPITIGFVTPQVGDSTRRAKVPFFFSRRLQRNPFLGDGLPKQWGGTNKKKAGRLLEGKKWDEVPKLKKVN